MTERMYKHGPWQALGPAEWDGDDGKWIVPGVAHCGNGELSEANARLIAAAPELLERGEEYQVQANALIGFLLDKLGDDLDEMDRIQINKWSQSSQQFDDAIAQAAGKKSVTARD